jgi:hypothetical protein
LYHFPQQSQFSTPFTSLQYEEIGNPDGKGISSGVLIFNRFANSGSSIVGNLATAPFFGALFNAFLLQSFWLLL